MASLRHFREEKLKQDNHTITRHNGLRQMVGPAGGEFGKNYKTNLDWINARRVIALRKTLNEQGTNIFVPSNGNKAWSIQLNQTVMMPIEKISNWAIGLGRTHLGGTPLANARKTAWTYSNSQQLAQALNIHGFVGRRGHTVSEGDSADDQHREFTSHPAGEFTLTNRYSPWTLRHFRDELLSNHPDWTNMLVKKWAGPTDTTQGILYDGSPNWDEKMFRATVFNQDRAKNWNMREEYKRKLLAKLKMAKKSKESYFTVGDYCLHTIPFYSLNPLYVTPDGVVTLYPRLGSFAVVLAEFNPTTEQWFEQLSASKSFNDGYHIGTGMIKLENTNRVDRGVTELRELMEQGSDSIPGFQPLLSELLAQTTTAAAVTRVVDDLFGVLLEKIRSIERRSSNANIRSSVGLTCRVTHAGKKTISRNKQSVTMTIIDV